MLILLFVLLQESLPHYEITVDTVLLEELYADPFEELEIPGFISYNGFPQECTIAFRGGTSLWCEKKSWHITVPESQVFPFGDHILLNSQFRDPSLMRNFLGLYITRELGLPAPEIVFISMSINNEYLGVYEQVERIDRLFYERNGLSFGPLFKNIDSSGRFARQFSDTTGLSGFEPKIDSYPYENQLLELIEDCFRGEFSSIEVSEILAAFVVHAAIGDQDGIVKNFYMHRNEDVWHYYPWDRDATFGNSWSGEYNSGWVTTSNLFDIGYFGAARGLLSNLQNREEFNSILLQTADIFIEDLPGKIDSIRLLIGNDLALDPYYEYTMPQFDSLCCVMIDDIEARADYLGYMTLEDEVPQINEISISSCLDMKANIEVEIVLSDGDPIGVNCPVAFNGQNEEWYAMEHDGDNRWILDLEVPPGTYSAHFSFGPFGSLDLLPIFYPSWGIRGFKNRPVPSPSARVALAGISPQFFSPGIPLWCGENLWVLPVTNTASEQQDISLCRFSLGDPAGNVFLAESILVAPGETFYLTNSSENAYLLYENYNVYGDAGTSYPAGSSLKLFDPSWNPLHSWRISAGDSLPTEYGDVFPSEISAGDGGDWVELYNNSEYDVDLSHWSFMDSEKNTSLVPEGTSIAAGELLLIASEPGLFQQVPCNIIPLDFSISSQADSLFLYSRLGDKVFCMAWNENWPIEKTGIMYLTLPQSVITAKENWESATPPGSPGELNPEWAKAPGLCDLFLTSQNPGNGFFSFHYRTPTIPAEVIIYDLAGRVRSSILIQENYVGDVTADFSDTLPCGVYILYLRSSGASASAHFTVLN